MPAMIGGIQGHVCKRTCRGKSAKIAKQWEIVINQPKIDHQYQLISHEHTGFIITAQVLKKPGH